VTDAGGDEAATFEQLEQLAARPATERYVLRLYVAGSTPRSTRAIQAITQLCQARLAGRHELEVVDVFQQPERAQLDQVLAVPTLVKLLPAPRRLVLGDLSKPERLLRALDLAPRPV
jgi:circadian clock protein KaiB